MTGRAVAGQSSPESASIEAIGLGKRYLRMEERAMLLKSLIPFIRPKKSEHWALRDFDLLVRQGETVGVLGRNGAGKTTLLRMLAGVTRPTTGEVRLRGRVAPLISVGVGFHQEMSGRENIFVNGMLLGLSRSEVAARLGDIIAFAELGDFLDTPVKFYSSGMFMRLGFAVASHVDPDILLVDEVLAVGDGAFQVKCMKRMRSMQQQGTTILIVSHSVSAIRLLCPRSILVRKGALLFDGPTEEAISMHNELMSAGTSSPNGVDGTGSVGPAVTIVERIVEGAHGPTNRPRRGERLKYRARVQFNQTVDTPQYHLQLISEEGSVVYDMHTVVDREPETVEGGTVLDVEAAITARLGPGTYRFVLRVCDRDYRTDLCSDGLGYTLFMDPVRGTAGTADLEGVLQVAGRSMSTPDDLLLSAVIDGILGGPEERADGP